MTDVGDNLAGLFSESTLPRETRSLHKRVAEVLREAIVAGQLTPGDHLNESRIANQLGVSRGPLREAIRDLEQEGLVRSTPHKGTVVLGISETEVHRLLIPMRIVIESFAATEIMPELVEDDFVHLLGIADRMRAAALKEIVEADVEFHEYILERSNQPHALQLWRLIRPRIWTYFYRHGLIRDTSKFADEHVELVEALRAGGEDELLSVLKEHIDVPWLEESSPTNPN